LERSLLPDVKRVFQRAPAWRQFEDELLAVAQQAADSTQAVDEMLDGKRTMEVRGVGPTVSEVPPTTPRDNPPLSRTTTGDATHDTGAEDEIDASHSRALSGSLSPRDAKIQKIVGEQSFRTLTNTEIMRTPVVGRRLRDEYELRSDDAAKSCLDRIRKAFGYPLSRDIAKKTVGGIIGNGQERSMELLKTQYLQSFTAFQTVNSRAPKPHVKN
jgi:hypothetical protein